MKIHSDQCMQQLSENNRAEAKRNAGVKAGGSSPAPVLGQDQVQFSAVHPPVQALAAQASQLPEIRADRVQVLRQAVASGNYHRSAQEIATAMISHLAQPQAA